MFTGIISTKNNFPKDEHKKLDETLKVLSEIFINECNSVDIVRGQIPFTRLSNLFVIADQLKLHIVADNVPVGGMARHTYIDRRNLDKIFSLDDIYKISVAELNFQKPVGFNLPTTILYLDREVKKQQLIPHIREICKQWSEQLRAPRIEFPQSFVYLKQFEKQFLQDHPHIDRNVFLMMRFKEGNQYDSIHNILRQEMEKYELNILRADDKDYTGDLWNNICLYMFGSKYGLAVFEEIDERQFNPSVALELGFMLALGKRCLILKDKRMPKMPTDIIGKLYKEFDTYEIEKSITKCVEAWVHDVGLKQ